MPYTECSLQLMHLILIASGSPDCSVPQLVQNAGFCVVVACLFTAFLIRSLVIFFMFFPSLVPYWYATGSSKSHIN